MFDVARRYVVTFSVRGALLGLCLVASAFTACDSAKKGSTSGSPPGAEGIPAQDATATIPSDGKLDMSAHSFTIHQMTAEMVNLMDDVHEKKIMRPPLKVSNVRNAFMERLDWIDEMSEEDVAKLRQASADLEALVAEIRSHESATGDVALEARLKKIEDWNRLIKEGIPK